jgi:hypothetical protein
MYYIPMSELRTTITVRGEERINALNELIRRDHSSANAILNKGLDLLVAHEARLERLAAGEEE